MVQGTVKGSLQEIVDASASDSKPSQSSRLESPEVEEHSAPPTKATAESSDSFAAPSAKRAKLLQQLAKVERQITDLEAGLVSSSDPAYSIFKGYTGLLPGNKRKVANQLSDTVFSDSSLQQL